MSATLIQQFDLLASSLGGVAKLRELILSLAVRGKLMPQAPADEPGSVLLQKIRAEKERLIAEGKIKKDKPLPPISDEEKPFELPNGWHWIRLLDISIKITDGEHISPEKTLDGMKLLTAKHVLNRGVSLDDPQFVSVTDGQKFRQRCDPERGDVLICSRGTIGRVCVVDTSEEFCLMGSVILVKPFNVNARFVHIYLSTSNAQQLMRGMSFATAVSALYLKDIKACPIPLPPLPEQSRIVAKVDELMALCDRLETEQGQAARVQGHWVEAALAQLAGSADADEFARHWQHLARHFDTLFTTPDSITQLEATLLQLAVRGKLAPQDPNDEPASTLLQKIRTEKDRLIAEGKIKKDKPLPPISDEEKPFDLPEGWKWVRLGELSNFVNGFAFPSNEFTNSGIGIVKIGDIQNGTVNQENMSYVSIEYASSIDPSFEVKPNDLLIAMSGATTGKLGFNKTDTTYLLNQRVGKIDFIKVNSIYACNYLSTKIAENLAKSSGSAIPNLSTGQIKEIEFPLPPLLEQSRIVAKVEALFALTAGLKAQLAKAQQMQALLAGALIDEVIA